MNSIKHLNTHVNKCRLLSQPYDYNFGTVKKKIIFALGNLLPIKIKNCL